MKKTKNPQKITSEKVVLTSFIVSLSDVLINFVATMLSGSVVMLSQAFEGAADLLASGFLLVGVKRSKRPADKKHPFGYGRELYFWTFLAALATFIITAGFSFYFGLKRFLHPEPIRNIYFSLFVLLITIFTNGYAMSLSFRRLLGKKPHTKILDAFLYPALIETKTAFVLDLMGTIASILGLIALITYQLTGNQRFDGLGAMTIGVTLAILALFIIKSAKDLLVGQAAPVKTQRKIIKAAKSFPQVNKVLDLRTLYIGPNRLLVNMEVNLIDKLETDDIERLIDKIKVQIKQEVPRATHIQIELETPDTQGLIKTVGLQTQRQKTKD